MKTLHNFYLLFSTKLLLFFFVFSCVPLEQQTKQSRTDVEFNEPSTVSVGHGRLLNTNPFVASGGGGLPANVNLGLFLSGAQEFITNGQTLERSCSSPDSTVTVDNCFKVLENANATALGPIQGKWAFDPKTNSFLQVHLYGHMQRIIDKYLGVLSESYTSANPLGTLGGGTYFTSISPNLYVRKAFWTDENVLTGFSNCESVSNAFFRPADFSICFGDDPINSGLSFVEDPSVIYHEMGHAFIRMILNQRAVASTAPVVTDRTDLGHIFYDEAGAIGEGISDYFSFFMNSRKHLGEWALGAFFNASRPMSEDDAQHAPGIDLATDARLSYPTFLNYDSNNHSKLIEDVHNSGMITSHYLISLTEDFKTFCSNTTEEAKRNVLYLIIETLGAMGDLTSKASDNYTNAENINLTSTSSISTLWTRVVTPINYRSFYQKLGQFLLKIFVNNATLCPGNALTQDRIEQLLDQYGLLLFKTYNEDGNGFVNGAAPQPGNAGPITQVNVVNRVRSLLIPKDLIIMNPDTTGVSAFVFDNGQEMRTLVENLKSTGQIFDLSTEIPSDLSFNNSNGRISPGELIGLALNVYNNSNLPMGGVQILANDWDHAKLENNELKLCNNFADNFPPATQGAADLTGDVSTNPGDCRHITKSNGGEAQETLAPVCFVQLRDTNETRWVDQNVFRNSIGLPNTKCLKGSSSPYDCFVRAIPGGEYSIYSKIDPQQTWPETIQGSSSTAPTFNSSNILLFEISPWIPPGTIFDCRFRVRFSNCDDCFTDSNNNNDDFLDYEYSGGDPFKLLHLEFTVID